MTTTRLVMLAELERDDTINARRHMTDEGIAELKASIGAHGIAQSLRVRPSASGKYRIVAGSRRHRALSELAEEGGSAGGILVDAGFLVPVLIGEDDDVTAREISQAENLVRLPQHEADTYETFRELAERGLDEGQIASRFGIEPHRVRRMLALGRLSPVILDAWRTGELSGNGFGGGNEQVSIVRAFTLAPSPEEQERVFTKLKKNGQLYAHTIRGEFGAAERNTGQHLDLVGTKEYVAAGGQVIEDLFGDNHVVSDPALLAKLVADKLQAKIDEAIKDGWSWASLADDLPSNWSYSWSKLDLSKKKATDAQKAVSGVVVSLDYQGKLNVTYGVVRPEKAQKEPAKEKVEAAPTISNAMAQRLSVVATFATAEALKQEPRIGIVALLAGFHTWSDAPIKVHSSGIGGAITDRESYDHAFKRFFEMSDRDLFKVTAEIAARALDMRVSTADRKPFAAAASMMAVIDGDRLTAALLQHFDAGDYFAGVAKPIAIQAIREALNDDEARKAEKLKKPELVAFAIENVPPTGWLPPELRCATYSGPGANPDATTPDDAEDEDV